MRKQLFIWFGRLQLKRVTLKLDISNSFQGTPSYGEVRAHQLEEITFPGIACQTVSIPYSADETMLWLYLHDCFMSTLCVILPCLKYICCFSRCCYTHSLLNVDATSWKAPSSIVAMSF